MKKTTTVFFLLLFSIAIFGQDITGLWNGILKVQGMQLRVNFNIDKVDEAYQATMDSPDQNAFGIPVDSTHFQGNIITIKIPKMGIEYKGTLTGDSIVGTFNQMGQSFPMNLSKKKVEKEKINRPQEPQQPQGYYQEDIKFENTNENIQLAGELTMPSKEGIFPAVILISGSGPQDRNEEVFGHKPFLVLANHLTKQGIAVLRFDDRGIGESTGDFKSATSYDFATDVKAAIAYLQTRKEIDHKKIGLIGHSEGGLIAPLVASQSDDVNFIALLAGPGIPSSQLLLLQSELISRASGLNETQIQNALALNKEIFELALKSKNIDEFRTELASQFKQLTKDHPEIIEQSGMSQEDFYNSQISQLATPWMYTFLRYDPIPVLKKVKCPVLAINGEKDLQVPAQIDIEGIEKALKAGGNTNVTTKIFPNLNHMFQECEKGLPAEYSQIEQTFSPDALDFISHWIEKQVF